MKKALLIAASALAGIALCGLSGALFNSSWFDVRFPAPGGEDDFAPRAAGFLFGVCPAFLLLGGWIGLSASRGGLNGVAAWAGAGCGVLVAFLSVFLLRRTIGTLIASDSATHAVYVFYVAWVLLAAVGAVVGGRLGRDN